MQEYAKIIVMPHRPAEGGVLLKARVRHTRIFLALLVPLVAVTSPSWPESSLPHEAMEWAGHLLVPAGVLIRVFASLYIGGRKNDELITDGPFSIVRNPLYVGSFGATTGLALLTGSLVMTALLALSFAAYYSATIAREEVFLHRKFGVRYRRYARRVPRWIPSPGLWESPEELAAKPRFVLRTILDGSLFLLCIPILESLCELRSAGAVPTLLTLL
jgi:protein-S-isoprenylcysteine O-methyltransferase Ste14